MERFTPGQGRGVNTSAVLGPWPVAQSSVCSMTTNIRKMITTSCTSPLSHSRTSSSHWLSWEPDSFTQTGLRWFIHYSETQCHCRRPEKEHSTADKNVLNMILTFRNITRISVDIKAQCYLMLILTSHSSLALNNVQCNICKYLELDQAAVWGVG